MAVTEITVVLKDDERTCRQKFLCYETFVFDGSNEYLRSIVEEAKKNFNGDPEEIVIRAVCQYK